MASPFEDVNAEYLLLGNQHGQYSLWPAAIRVPNGWTVRHPAGGRAACLARVEAGWPDLAVVASGHRSEAACLSQIFEERADANPDAVAMEFDGTRMSYAELNARANQLARHLIATGLGSEQLVALGLRRGPALIVAQLAVTKAGAAFLPLDLRSPPDRLHFILADSAPACLITSTEVVAGFAGWDGPLLMIDDPVESLPASNLRDADRHGQLSPDNAAYVIYTSGSTGRPKGVVVTHSGLANLAASAVDRLRLRSDSRVLQVASPEFDAAIIELLMAFAVGAALVIPDDVAMAGDALRSALIRQRITHALVGPAVLASIDPAGLEGLECLVVGGEACPEPLAARWAKGRLMINAYGPTEATVAVTLSEPLSGRGTPPIGRPIRGTTVHVLDERLRPAPPGGTGELYLAGPALARGYLNRPGLTAERFVANPFDAPGSRMYRTGDVVRLNKQSVLEFVGRADNQVKVRGYRIEPGEIEAALERCDAVRQAAVTAREQRPGDTRLVAYVVLEAGYLPHIPTLREHLGAILPRHMIPWAFTFLDALPLTRSGKVDRAALPEPEFRYDERPATPARTPREQLLCDLFAEELGIGVVGIDDDFFAAGGDSLTAAKLISRIRAEVDLAVTAQMFFSAPTVAGLTRCLG